MVDGATVGGANDWPIAIPGEGNIPPGIIGCIPGGGIIPGGGPRIIPGGIPGGAPEEGGIEWPGGR